MPSSAGTLARLWASRSVRQVRGCRSWWVDVTVKSSRFTGLHCMPACVPAQTNDSLPYQLSSARGRCEKRLVVVAPAVCSVGQVPGCLPAFARQWKGCRLVRRL